MKELFTGRDLARLIAPLMLELALTLLVGMIDSVMLAGVGEAAVSGVSLIDTVFQLLIYIFAAFGAGGAVVAGQYLGANRTGEARDAADQLVWFSGLISLAAAAIVLGAHNLLLDSLFGAITPEVHLNASRYLRIAALSIPAISIYESGAAIFRTMGSTGTTMRISLAMNAVNVLGNAVLIYGAHWGAAGAAAATVAARCVAALLMIALLLRPKQSLHLTRSLRFRPNGALIRRILRIGVPNGIENGLFQLGKILLARLVACFGTSAIAANAVCQVIASIQVIPGSAVSTASVTVIARCTGADDEPQIRRCSRRLLAIAYGVLIPFCGALWLALPAILSWYHLSPETALLARQMVLTHTLGAMIIWPLAFVLPSFLRAAGDVRFAMAVSVLSMFAFRLGAAWLLARRLGAGALSVWLAMICDWAFRALVFSLRWLNGRWRGKSVIGPAHSAK
ncbi:MAG: MATE family efflux transporter [Candidatus Faecivicinus sp.]